MRVLARFLFIALVANFEFAGFRKENKYTAYDHLFLFILFYLFATHNKIHNKQEC